jgi:membrane protease YdiL (CAAX protease family)
MRPAAEPDVPWRGRGAIAVALLAVVITILVAALAPRLDPALLFPVLAMSIGLATLVWAALHGRVEALFGDRFRVGLGTLGMAALGWVVVFGLQILVGAVVVTLLGPDAAPEAGGLPSDVLEGPPWSLVLGAVVVAPVAEELYFRGFLLQGLWRSFGPRWAIVLSAVVFGIFHFGGARLQTVLPMVSATLIGLVFGYLFVRTRNLAVTVLAHALVNGVAISVVLFLTEG